MDKVSTQRFSGYILQGGPYNDFKVRGRIPDFVRVEYGDSTADIYRPTGKPHDRDSEFQAFAFEELHLSD